MRSPFCYHVEMEDQGFSDRLSKFLSQIGETPEAERLEREWCERMSSPLEMDGFKLVCTCGACPEQYDVFNAEGRQVGYLRLRHGHFRADYPDVGGETVYEADTKGDGIFDDDERMDQLKSALRAIKKRLVAGD